MKYSYRLIGFFAILVLSFGCDKSGGNEGSEQGGAEDLGPSALFEGLESVEFATDGLGAGRFTVDLPPTAERAESVTDIGRFTLEVRADGRTERIRIDLTPSTFLPDLESAPRLARTVAGFTEGANTNVTEVEGGLDVTLGRIVLHQDNLSSSTLTAQYDVVTFRGNAGADSAHACAAGYSLRGGPEFNELPPNVEAGLLSICHSFRLLE